jgi:hypothetical protein
MKISLNDTQSLVITSARIKQPLKNMCNTIYEISITTFVLQKQDLKSLKGTKHFCLFIIKKKIKIVQKFLTFKKIFINKFLNFLLWVHRKKWCLRGIICDVWFGSIFFNSTHTHKYLFWKVESNLESQGKSSVNVVMSKLWIVECGWVCES